MAEQLHIIKKLTIDVQCISIAKAQHYQQEIKSNYIENIVKTLTEVFSEFDDNSFTYNISKLEINLGKINSRQLAFTFNGKLNTKVKNELERLLSQPSRQGNVAIMPKIFSNFRLFHYLISHGSWPWWVKQDQCTTIGSIFSILLDKNTKQLIQLLHMSLQQEDWLQRWIDYLSDQELLSLCQAALRQHSKELKNFYQSYQQLYQHLPDDLKLSKTTHRMEYWRACLSSLIDDNQAFNANYWLHNLLNHFTVLLQKPYSHLLNRYWQVNKELAQPIIDLENLSQEKSLSLNYRISIRQIWQQTRSLLQKIGFSNKAHLYAQALDQLNKECHFIKQQVLDKNWQSFLTQLQKILQLMQAYGQSQSVSNSMENVLYSAEEKLSSLSNELIRQGILDNTKQDLLTDSDDDTEEYFVSYAGIVLLIPFLSHFFNHGELLQNGQFINPAAIEQALLLLHFLTSGEVLIADINLSLLKLLCGLSVTQPITISETLTSVQKEAAEELLLTVIGYWSILRNTSIAGLRQAFLQREGLLKREVSGWCLYIEKKSYDVLLNKLPWEINPVQLPWLQQSLVVSWY